MGDDMIPGMECTHGMPSPKNCVTCMEEGILEKPSGRRPIAITRPFPARYQGWCWGCDQRILVDDMIVQTDSGAAHSVCAADVE